MEIDLARAGTELETSLGQMWAEVCIVGGGIAGLVLANKLSAAGVDVLLLEAGSAGGERMPPADVVLAGEAHRGTAEGRTWALGGSSATWGGQLLPMPDAATWPFPPGALTPYFAHVHELLGVDALPYEAEAFFPSINARPPRFLSNVLECDCRLSKFAPFSKRSLAASLGKKVRADARTRVVLRARVTSLALCAAGDRVDEVQVRTPGGARVCVRARHFVLAAGTVETCRLLLASQSVRKAGVGNAFGQIGRCFHDHLTVEVARLQGIARARVLEQLRPWVVGGMAGTLHALKLEAGATLRDRLGLNFALAHVSFEEPEGTGVAAVRELLRGKQQGVQPTAGLWKRLPAGAVDAARLYREAGRGRRYVSPRARLALRVNVAQTPSASSIRLSARCDGFGEPLAEVDWRVLPEDLRSIRVFAGYLRTQLEKQAWAGASDVLWHPDLLRPEAAQGEPIGGIDDARHAMGGARMGVDPRTSAVDTDLRVHGVENLFVASAAVFPDGSPQLPTLTLLALTLRLAEHLQAEQGR